MTDIRDIKDRTPNQATVQMLEQLLEDAKKGEIRTIVAVTGWDDDGFTHSWSLDERNGRRRLLGELSMLQYDLLTNTAFEDGNTVINKAFED